MVVGLCELRFRLHGARTLKEKRAVVRKIVDRTRARFTVTVAEVGNNNAHEHARIGLAVLGSDSRNVESVVDRVIAAIEEMYIADLQGVEREIFHWGDPTA